MTQPQEDRLAASGTAQDLAALVDARARLEAALSGDESWRALHGSAGADEEGAARRARNTRLKMALAQNPLYQAWKHLGEAIAALEQGRAAGEAAAGVVAPPPREVGADAVSQGAYGSLARRLEVTHPDAPARVAGHAAPQATDGSPTAAPAAAPGAAPPAQQRGWDGGEPDEATVTIVEREPLLPSVEQPTAPTSRRGRGLSERLRNLASEPDTAPDSFAVTGRGVEAEVVIVAPEGAKAEPDGGVRASARRRVRKTQSPG
jgi:hypothetical protein